MLDKTHYITCTKNSILQSTTTRGGHGGFLPPTSVPLGKSIPKGMDSRRRSLQKYPSGLKYLP